jgi:hypothetical protein
MVADNQQHYPMDDITMRTPCELLYQQKKKIKVVANGIAEVLAQGGKFMARRFLKVMLMSWLTESRKDGKTSISRSLEAMEKRNYNMPSTTRSIGTSATKDFYKETRIPQHLLRTQYQDRHRHHPHKGDPAWICLHHLHKGILAWIHHH